MSHLTKEQNARIDQYCIECIQDDTTVGMTNDQKLLHLWDRFNAEADGYIKRVGTIKAFSEWLSGLPIAIDYLNIDILNLAELWCQETKTERQQDNILNDWWDFMAGRYIELIRRIKA